MATKSSDEFLEKVNFFVKDFPKDEKTGIISLIDESEYKDYSRVLKAYNKSTNLRFNNISDKYNNINHNIYNIDLDKSLNQVKERNDELNEISSLNKQIEIKRNFSSNKKNNSLLKQKRFNEKRKYTKLYCLSDCVYSRKYENQKMIRCDICEEWYHYECLKIPNEKEIEIKNKWSCPNCSVVINNN